MMRPGHRTWLALLVVPVSLLSGCAERLEIGSREQWVAQQSQVLRDFRPRPDSKAAIWKSSEGVVRIDGDQGLVRLAGGEWVYFTSYSSHSHQPDVILAIDQEGNLYGNNGHVCPYLILNLPRGRQLTTAADFFTTRVHGKDFKRKRWHRIGSQQ